ncbi:patatin-like phospholipase family protein [Bradyrhizobium sp. AZCC 1693]|uniref:patatin-like phospholipase family protein n=1 Tax=Bradyrhizobium sp. AZCC 1693 TaxID=3117029 RepID=UPI002FF2A10D
MDDLKRRLAESLAASREAAQKASALVADAIGGPDTTVLADAGDVFHDEFNAIELRRNVLAGNGYTEPASLTAGVPGADATMEDYCRKAHGLQNLSALCLSGGGIRSAAFALGVVQGLAKRQVLYQFDYLSTVSGGGYLGSFLTAWVQRKGYGPVCEDLVGDFKPGETSPLQYLRRYTSYLTPDRGLVTADALTVLALYVRNLFLNWLIIVPLVLCVIIAPKFYVAAVGALPGSQLIISSTLMLAITVMGLASLESLRQRPGWESRQDRKPEAFQIWQKWPMLVAGLAASIASLKFLESGKGISNCLATHPVDGAFFPNVEVQDAPQGVMLGDAILFAAGIVAAVSFIAWMIAFFVSRPPNPSEISTRSTVRVRAGDAIWSVILFTLSGAVIGMGLGLAFYWIAGMCNFALRAFVVLCFGPLIVIAASFLGEMIYIGLTSDSKWSDGEREWLATAEGYHGRTAVTWMLLMLLVFGGSYGIFYLADDPDWYKLLPTLGGTGGVTAVIVAWLGKASATAANIRERYNTWKNWSSAAILAVAMPVFLIITTSFLSAGVDWLVAKNALSYGMEVSQWGIGGLTAYASGLSLLWRLVIVLAICLTVLLGASYRINTNRFSLHGLYRNRLIRAFLGASRAEAERKANPLTGFDEKDNVDLCDLWPNKYEAGIPPQYLVVNCSLNVLKSSELAWQERKAMSMTFTPRAAGARALDDWKGYYRRASEYSDRISLGTAMTISGAAVSPNMGYHSSSALSVLMTFFNVRLGAWLGNPGPAGAQIYKASGPRFSAWPILIEALGLTTEKRSYVYLSDGGHFENLGLYEMIQRRCRFIVVSDAGCDPGITFEDLGNAVRKISIDLNVKLEFDSLRIPARKDPPVTGTYFAMARIIYPEAGAPVGRLLYIKPSYQGTEPPSVRSYAEANPAFPHEPTGDQFFGESQFEAYRALGEYIIQNVDGGARRSYTDVERFMDAVAAHSKKSSTTAGQTQARGYSNIFQRRSPATPSRR